ncbi:MAG: hypothetical protein U5L96_19485 [Owenweeksia sp.]|nr:hypothetical protein [Owenweeksia sp.]
MVQPLDEKEAQKQFNAVATFLQQQGYEHYEVSNFARPGHRAIHNTSYWQDEPYLGIGPSAHSYDGESRQWNVANNQLYLSAVAEDEVPYEKENLSVAERYNEMVMTSLRRIEGIDLAVIDEKFGAEFSDHLVQEAAPLKSQGKLVQHGARLYIPTPQRFFSDGVAAGLFYV